MLTACRRQTDAKKKLLYAGVEVKVEIVARRLFGYTVVDRILGFDYLAVLQRWLRQYYLD